MDDPAAEPSGASTGRSGHPAAVAAALAVFLTVCAGLTAGLTGWAEHRAGRALVPPHSQPHPAVAAAVDPSAALARVAAVQPLLDRRATAVRSARRDVWDGTLDPAPAAAAFRSRQLAEFDRIRSLPVRDWRYQLLETTPSIGASDTESFVARVRLAYRLGGDTRDVERVQTLTVVRGGGSWVIRAVRSDAGAADPWEVGPLTVLTGRRSVVVGVGRPPSRSLRRTVQEADEAADRVDAVWGTTWPRTVVLFLPADGDQLAALLGQRPGADLDQVAAVTHGELLRDPTTAAGSADRIVLNPGSFGRLSALGRRVVLTHELTHVATRATSRVTLPLWVEEGFANYVAYRDSGLSRSLIAADVLPLVRAGTAGQRLPDSADFDPALRPIAAAYADAWLAYDLMARGGADRPLEFYRVAAGLAADQADQAGGLTVEQTLPEAFRRVLGTDPLSFEVRWRAHREALAQGRLR